MGALFAPFVRSRLHGSAAAFGTIVSAQAIGGIVGGLAVAALAHRVSAWSCLALGSIAFGLIDLAMFLYPLAYERVWPAIALMVVVGFPGALLVAGLMTIYQTATTDPHRGRIFGLMATVEGAASLAGIAAAAGLAPLVGIVPVLAVDAAAYTGCGVVVAFLARPRNRAALDSAPVEPASAGSEATAAGRPEGGQRILPEAQSRR